MGDKKLKKKVISKRVKTIVLTVILFAFILGYFIGWYNTDRTLSEAELDVESLNLDLRSVNQRIQFAHYFEDQCDVEHINFISRTISQTTDRLVDMEAEDKVDTSNYELLKKRHNINQVLFYSELKKFREECNYDRDIILFFFDTEREESDLQGLELDSLRAEHDLIVIPMDFGFTSHIDYFYDYHDPSELPYIEVNYDTIFEGFTTAEEIEPYLNG